MGFLFSPHYQAVNDNGDPLSGAKLYFYEVGTTNEITTYQEAALTTPHTNPVVADSAGLFAPIYLNTSPFKTQLDTSADVAVQTVQTIYGGIDSGNIVGDDVATAATIVLDAEGPSFDLTGTTTVSTITLGEGKQRRARATGSFQLTASANLVVNGNASVNLAVSSGDMLFLWGFASSIVYVWGVAGGGLTAANNLSDVSSAPTSFTNIKQAASKTATGVVEFATIAEYRTGTDTGRALVVDQVWNAGAEVTLTDAATITVDMATFLNGKVTLAGNRTLGQPSNAKIGQEGFIRVIQDGTGNRTLAYHSDWKFAGGVDPTASTGAADVDLLFYKVIATNFIFATLVKDLG